MRIKKSAWIITVTAALLTFGFSASAVFALNLKKTTSPAHYYGDVNFFSPEGNKPRGKTVSLAKRSINPSRSQIVEIILQPSRNPGQKPKEIVTTMSRIAGSKTFTATDEEHAFSGTITFEDDGLGRWIYDIRLKDGSKIAGQGSLDLEGLKTSKTFSNSQGIPAVLIKEDLKEITLEQYRERYQEILGE